MREHIRKLLNAGLMPVPAHPTQKRPIIEWARFYDSKPSDETVISWGWGPRICILTGEPSGGLEVIDFDQQAAAFPTWAAEIQKANPELFDKLTIQDTQGGGKHVIYRCSNHEPSQKLARNREGNVLIETRGTRGVIMAEPTPGYQLSQGQWDTIQYISPAYRNFLIQTARGFNVFVEETPTVVYERGKAPPDDERPGDKFNRENTTLEVLLRHGWTIDKEDSRQIYLRRPGKSEGHSATLYRENDCVWVFSSNAGALQEGRNYDAYGVYVALEHNGDFAAAARHLASEYEPPLVDDDDIDLSGLIHEARKEEKATLPQSVIDDMPRMLRIAWESVLETAHKPQPELTLGCLLSFFGAVVGRRVSDMRNTRTNLMVLGVAPSGEGKEHPRQWVKTAIAQAECLEIEGPEQIGSHAGVVSSLSQNAVKLFQNDEIGRLLVTMANPGKAPHLYQIGTVLMTLYSSAGVGWTGPAYADLTKVKRIEHPHLCVYGSSTPDTLFTALNSDTITGGLIGRMLIFEGRRVEQAIGDDFEDDPEDMPAASAIPVPPEVIEWVRYWRHQCYQPEADEQLATDLADEVETDIVKRHALGFIDFADMIPCPAVIRRQGEAKRLLAQYAAEIDARREDEDPIRSAIWARSVEKVAKLALLYAVCDAPPGAAPIVSARAVRWAKAIVNYSNRCLSQAASTVVADTTFSRNCKRVYSAWDYIAPRRDVQRKCSWLRPFEFAECLEALQQWGLIEIVDIKPDTPSGGRPRRVLKKTGESAPW